MTVMLLSEYESKVMIPILCYDIAKILYYHYRHMI